MATVYVVRWAENEGGIGEWQLREHSKRVQAVTAGRAIAALKRERKAAGRTALYVKAEPRP